jgi:hypothetical protein
VSSGGLWEISKKNYACLKNNIIFKIYDTFQVVVFVWIFKTNFSVLQLTNFRSEHTNQSSSSTLCGNINNLYAASAVQRSSTCRPTIYYVRLPTQSYSEHSCTYSFASSLTWAVTYQFKQTCTTPLTQTTSIHRRRVRITFDARMFMYVVSVFPCGLLK